jgi:Domain of unknown function (DUF4263)
MKEFIENRLDFNSLLSELLAFEDLLSSHEYLGEASHILPFFKNSPNLSTLIGKIYFFKMVIVNKIAYEFDIFGDFKADLVIGDAKNETFTFVEFEDGGHDSIFRKVKGKYLKDWSPKFEHGYSQIIDWFWKLDDLKQTSSFIDKFGVQSIDYQGILIIGRSKSFETINDLNRFKWRRNHTLIHSKKIHCITYDELLEDLKRHIKFLQLSN